MPNIRQELTSQEILYEDNHLLVVDKPVGIPTMGAPKDELTVAKMAAQYLKKKYAKPGNVFVGVVSRLDSRVSGVLILARTSKAASRLSEQIRQRRMQKHYLACVEGNLTGFDETCDVVHLLRKNESLQKMEVCDSRFPQNKGSQGTPSQEAVLRLQAIGQYGSFSLCQVELVTGRKHQIRVQLAELGHPIVGDAKYGAQRKHKGAGIALHCISQSVKHPTREEVLEFHSSPKPHWSVLPRPLLDLIP